MHNYLYDDYRSPTPGDMITCIDGGTHIVIGEKIEFYGITFLSTLTISGGSMRAVRARVNEQIEYFPYYPSVSDYA